MKIFQSNTAKKNRKIDDLLDEQKIDYLIKSAGALPELDSERSQRVFKNVHEDWRKSLKPQEPKLGFSAASLSTAWATAACLIFAFCVFFVLSSFPVEKAVFVAHVDKLKGEVTSITGKDIVDLANGDAIYSRQFLQTTKNSGIALKLGLGHSLRVDQNTRIRLISENELELVYGAIYFDSGLDTHSTKLKVYTRYGLVSDIGTQFEVRLSSNKMNINVREGEVVLGAISGDIILKASEKLWLSGSEPARISHISTVSPEWSWTQSLAPSLDFDGLNLSEFLARLSRENGWDLNYSSSKLQDYALNTQLHGSIAGMNNAEILQTVSIVSDIAYKLDSGSLFISPKVASKAVSD